MNIKWIGPTIVVASVAIAGAAVWYWKSVQPIAGDEIDKVPCNGKTLVVRSEVGGDRSFIELRGTGDQVEWQGLIPHYTGRFGRPGIACGETAATVRVQRSGRAEVFGFLLESGDKIGGFRLAAEREPITLEPTGPITMSDHVRSYEFVGGPSWHQVIAVDLPTGKALWKVDLGPGAISDAALEGGKLHVHQGARERILDVTTGRDETVTNPVN